MSTWNEKFDRFVGHYSKYQDSPEMGDIPTSRIRVIDSDIGRKVDFQRIAPHHIVLPPHCRTSSPHAENLEEEFVFVLKGTPHLWLNGYIHELSEGHAVGFPAGTGVAHTIINNSDAEVHLLVVGERTKADNLCSFPVNPELKESCGIWWGTPPHHELGPHLGLPGPFTPDALGSHSPECLTHSPSEPRRKPFHYPGDNETFGEGFRISDKVGLKALGIWYEKLPPGKRSAFPHAHTHEEEFIFVIKGRPTMWLDGYVKQIEPGYFAAFPANTGTNHVLINDTDADVIYICIGETAEFADERISYPLNDLRRRECERKSWYWTDAPTAEWGSTSPKSKLDTKEHLAFQPCSEHDAPEIEAIFQQSPSYFQRVEGCLPSLSLAEYYIADMPKERGENYYKDFLMIKMNGKSIGVIELHANHPTPGTCYLGLLLLQEDHFGKGLGRKCYELAEDYIRRALGCKQIRLGVSAANDVAVFWEKLGFTFNGKTYTWTGKTLTSQVQEFEKTLTL